MFKFIYAAKHYFFRKIYLGFTIPQNFLVLDIGSGDKPFWRGDVFVDDLSMEDAQRAGNSATSKIGVFVDANAENLPFDDETFDFVYCSHLLEHVLCPNKVINEILRVTKSSGGGYIECPSGIADVISPFHGHLWLIFNSEDVGLKFIRQSKELHNAAKENIQIREKLSKLFFWNGYLLFIQIFWTKKVGISHSISDNLLKNDKYVSLHGKNYISENEFNADKFSFRFLLIKIIRQFFLKRNAFKANSISNSFQSYNYNLPIKNKYSSIYIRKNSKSQST